MSNVNILAVVAASFGINYQFANRPSILWLVDDGYDRGAATIEAQRVDRRVHAVR